MFRTIIKHKLRRCAAFRQECGGNGEASASPEALLRGRGSARDPTMAPARVPGAPVQVFAVLRLAYDDEAGKGDYRHRDGVETPYEFQGLDRLLADFEADLAAVPAEEGHDE
jgi:hypothetical protein